MEESSLKKSSTIGSCGIDCGLCPRFYTRGDSACPGCGGLNFKEKHPSCAMLSCCAVKNGFEVCAQCGQYPCKRYTSSEISNDSFVTHQRMPHNHQFIQTFGLEAFLQQQKERIQVLNYFLDYCDDGRSKSFYCLVCALFPLESLHEIQQIICSDEYKELLNKELNKLLKQIIQERAATHGIDLRLVKKAKNQ